MNELTVTQSNNRLQLLSTVSALSLLFAISTNAKAEDANRPTVWIDLGGQLSRLENKQELYSPPFLAMEPEQFDSPLPSMRPTGYAMDVNGAISIQPEGSNWNFLAAVRYGRSRNHNVLNQQSYPASFPAKVIGGFRSVAPYAAQHVASDTNNRESHAVVDFLVGRDVGLGLFGNESVSTIGAGIRFAQFQSRTAAVLNEDPDWHFATKYVGVLQAVHQPYHTYQGDFEAERSFRGVGPSLSWKNAIPLSRDGTDESLTFDWGINGALLFGRQKTRTQHQTSAQYHAPAARSLLDRPGRVPVYHHPTDAPAYYSTRDRNVTVPNVGGFAGMSFRYDNAKVSFGYRADFFFGAIDGGIDARKAYDRNFYGPYASVSIGLGH